MEASSGTRFLLSLLNALSPRYRVNLPINPNYLTYDKKVVKAYIDDPLVFKKPTVRLLHELIKAADSVWRFIDGVSVLIMMLHGAEDKVAPPRATQEVFSRLRVVDKVMRIYEDMHHEVLNEVGKDVVYRDVLD